MKVLLVNPPWSKEGYYGVRAGAKWPHLIPFDDENDNYKRPFVPFPFHLAYGASILKNKGHRVFIIDAIASQLDDIEFFARVMDIAPDVIVQEVSTPTLVVDLKYAQEMKRICDRAKIVFCGPNAFMKNESFLESNNFIDFVIYGEYEYTLRNLINELEIEEPAFKIINGLIYRDNGKIIKNPPASLIENVDTLPWPAREMLPLGKYGNEIFELPRPSLQVMTGRGCPMSCSFCSWPLEMYGNNSYRVRKSRDIVEEIAFCVKKWDFKSYFFDDDTFYYGEKNYVEFAQEIKKQKINLPFSISIFGHTLKKEAIDVLADVGLYSVVIGIESASEEVLKKRNSKLDLNKTSEIIEYLKEKGIKVITVFYFGLEYETAESINETINYAVKMDTDNAKFVLIVPSLGSRYYKQLEKKGYIMTKNIEEFYISSKASYRTDNLSAEELDSWLAKAKRVWWVHKHLKTKEFDLEGMKNFFHLQLEIIEYLF